MSLCVCGHPSDEHVQHDDGEYCYPCKGTCSRYRKAADSIESTAILSAGVTPEGLAGTTVSEPVNEAAERLRRLEPTDPYEWDADIDAALATERRNTVERIRERVTDANTGLIQAWLGRILDEVAS